MSVSLRVGSRSSFSASRGRATSFGRTGEGRSLVDTSESDVRVIWLTSGAYSTAGRQLSLLACRLGVGRRVRGAISWPAACRAARGSHLSQGYVPGRPGGVYGSLAAVRGCAEPGDDRRGTLHPAPRRSDDLGCGPGHDRHHIPGEPREQAKAIGVFSFVASASGSVVLLAGGMLTQAINWHRVFFINVPIGVATALLSLRLLKKDTGIGFGEGADVPGAVQTTGSLMLGVYTIVESADDYGWGVGPTLGLGTISLVLLAAFVVREATAPNPLIPLRIFRSRNLSGVNVIQALTVAGMFGMIFLGVLYLQRVLGYDRSEEHTSELQSRQYLVCS